MSLCVEIIELTFERAKIENGGARWLGLRFYERLFEKYPQVRPLFKTPPEQQHQKLMASLAAIVASIKQPERLLPYLKAMGIRHIAYGTESPHYESVAENLVAVLGEHLSAEGEWTDAMRDAWTEALQVVSQVMIEAAECPDGCRMELQAAGFGPDGFRRDGRNAWEPGGADTRPADVSPAH